MRELTVRRTAVLRSAGEAPRRPRVLASFLVMIGLVLMGGLIVTGGCGDEWGRGGLPAERPEGPSEIAQRYGCSGCHTIPGLDAEGVVGPPLHFWADRVFIAGALRNDMETTVEWIVSPQSFREPTAMPLTGISPQEAEELAEYLFTLER